MNQMENKPNAELNKACFGIQEKRRCHHMKFNTKKTHEKIEHYCATCTKNVILCSQCISGDNPHATHTKYTIDKLIQNAIKLLLDTLNKEDQLGAVEKYLVLDKETLYKQNSKSVRDFMSATVGHITEDTNTVTNTILEEIHRIYFSTDDLIKKRVKYLLNCMNMRTPREVYEQHIIQLRNAVNEAELTDTKNKIDTTKVMKGIQDIMVEYRKDMQKSAEEHLGSVNRKMAALITASKGMPVLNHNRIGIAEAEINYFKERENYDDHIPEIPQLQGVANLKPPNSKNKDKKDKVAEKEVQHQQIANNRNSQIFKNQEEPERFQQSFTNMKSNEKEVNFNNEALRTMGEANKGLNYNKDCSSFGLLNSISHPINLLPLINSQHSQRSHAVPWTSSQGPKPSLLIPSTFDFTLPAKMSEASQYTNLPSTQASWGEIFYSRRAFEEPSSDLPPNNIPSTPQFYSPPIKFERGSEQKPVLVEEDSESEEIPYLHEESRKKPRHDLAIDLSSWNSSVITNAGTIIIKPVEYVKKLEDFECLGLTSYDENLYFRTPHSFEATNLKDIAKTPYKSIEMGRSANTPYFTCLHAFQRNFKNTCLLSIPKNGEPKLLELDGKPAKIFLEVPEKKILCCDFSSHNILVASTDSGSLLVWLMSENSYQELQIDLRANLIHIFKAEDHGNNGEMSILLRGAEGFYLYQIKFPNPDYANDGKLLQALPRKQHKYKDQNISCIASSIRNPNYFYFAQENIIYTMSISLSYNPQKLYQIQSLHQIQQMLIIDCAQYHYILAFDQKPNVKDHTVYNKMTTLCVHNNQVIQYAEPQSANIQWENGKTQLQFVKTKKGELKLMMITKHYSKIEEDSDEVQCEHQIKVLPIDLL
jgi:hypothetical protein